MTIEAGVWIDEYKAVVFLTAEGGQGFQHFRAADSNAAWQAGDLQPASDRSRRIRHNRFFDDIIACLHEADGIVVLGPGESKWEFARRIAIKNLKGDVAHVGTVETLTESEIAAQVREALDHRWRPGNPQQAPNPRHPAAHAPLIRQRRS